VYLEHVPVTSKVLTLSPQRINFGLGELPVFLEYFSQISPAFISQDKKIPVSRYLAIFS
jgi:hypothetical protein